MSYEYEYYKNAERDQAQRIYWAGVFVWAGLIFAFDLLFSLPHIGVATTWTWVVAGAGLYGMFLNAYYALSHESINPKPSDWLWSGFWLVIGLSGFFTTNLFWPLVLIIVGGIVLAGEFRRG